MHFRDLGRQYQNLKTDINKNISKVLSDANYINGSQVIELENQLAEYVGVKHCISCANGTDALLLALMAWNIGEGDAVFIPDFTFFATGEVVECVNAMPVFVDVDKQTFNMDAKSLEEQIIRINEEGKYSPKAVICVDLFGLPADYDSIKKITRKYNLLLLEDGAQGFGGQVGEQKACSFGDIGTTSFFPAKPLGCYGDGGAIFTNNDEWCDLLNYYKVHGKGSDKYNNIRIGMNSRLDTLQAAVLLVKLKAFRDIEIVNINRIAEKYNKSLHNKVSIPLVPKNYTSSYAQYTLTLNDKKQRDSLQRELKLKGIPSMIYYPRPLHSLKAFQGEGREFDYTKNFASNDICDQVLSIPIHPYLEQEEIYEVVHSIMEFF